MICDNEIKRKSGELGSSMTTASGLLTAHMDTFQVGQTVATETSMERYSLPEGAHSIACINGATLP